METKFLFVPVGEKQNEKGQNFFYCPKTRKIFGPLADLIVEEHLKHILECACFALLSRTEGSRIIIKFERTQNLHQMCHIEVKYENPSNLERIEKIVSLYIQNYNNGNTLVELPKQFYKPQGTKWL
ncbi:MAG: hypothetical protein N3G19_00685 [Candidatus Pacearchaeota archaeon]|nr:hypothetical protein [Candidatus Pacearchaeota archaeon]